MMEHNIKNSGGGYAQSSFPTLSILGLIFVTLKLTGYITWPWIWVTAPFWIPFIILTSFMLICFAVGGAVFLWEKFER